MPNKTVQRMAKTRQASTAKMGVHKDAYALYSGPGRKPRNGKVTVTVDKATVAAAFAANRDTNATRSVGVVTTRPDQAFRPMGGYTLQDPQNYPLVILPQSHSITR